MLSVNQNCRRFACSLGLALALLAGCSERLEWRELKSPDGYGVMLPGRAQTVERDVAFEGHQVPVTMTSTGIGPAMFAVGVARLPAALAADAAASERTIAHFRDGLVRNIDGAVTVAGPATLVLAPGSTRRLRAAQLVEARGKVGANGRAAQLAARFFIVDDRLYEVIALSGEGAIGPNALDTFFTSFRLQP
jgi:hypothetical protein